MNINNDGSNPLSFQESNTTNSKPGLGKTIGHKRKFNLTVQTSNLEEKPQLLSSPLKKPALDLTFTKPSMIYSKESDLTEEKVNDIYEKMKYSFICPVKSNDVKSFLDRGGQIEIVDKDPIKIKQDTYIVGCTAGLSRSQSLKAYLNSNDCGVQYLFAGSTLDMNKDKIHFETLHRQNEFYAVFNGFKQLQTGSQEKEPKKYFDHLFQNLESGHFLCFGECSLNALKRLVVNNKNKDLSAFKITHIRWDDEIKHPIGDRVRSESVEAHQLFLNKLKNHIIVEKLS